MRRFEPVPNDANVALDTQTGQLCKTWEWKNSKPGRATSEGAGPQVTLGEFAPTCLSLYIEWHPSTFNKDTSPATSSPGTFKQF